jgi:hypothetical protein
MGEPPSAFLGAGSGALAVMDERWTFRTVPEIAAISDAKAMKPPRR